MALPGDGKIGKKKVYKLINRRYVAYVLRLPCSLFKPHQCISVFEQPADVGFRVEAADVLESRSPGRRLVGERLRLIGKNCS